MGKYDLVLIAEENLPALQWKLGRTIETYSGNDNLIQVVKLKTTSGELIRPVVKLPKLPLSSKNPQIANRVELMSFYLITCHLLLDYMPPAVSHNEARIMDIKI